MYRFMPILNLISLAPNIWFSRMSFLNRIFNQRPFLAAGFAACTLLTPLALPAHAADEKIHMKYDIYASGLKVYRINLNMALNKKGYATNVTVRAKGFFKLFADSSVDMAARGHITPTGVMPRTFNMVSDSKKKNRRVAIIWDGKENPTIKRNYTLNKQRDQAINKLLTPGIANPLTFIARNASQPAAKACSGTERVFTGKAVYEYSFQRKGIKRFDSKKYKGPTLFCTLTMRPIAGLSAAKMKEAKANPSKPYLVWYAPVAGKNGTHLIPIYAKGELKGKSFEMRFKKGEIGGVAIKKRVASLK